MRFFRDNGLTIFLMAAFLFSFVGMLLSGWPQYNQELARHGVDPIGLIAYMGSGQFISSVFENWESEFLQMSTYVVATAYLFQRGSAESRDPDEPAEPAPAHESVGAWLYSHSLGLALGLLFVLSFVLHWLNSVRAANELGVLHGEAAISALAYLGDPQLWFESFQNWQSEFLSTAGIVVLSIFLRYRGSPESKHINAEHEETGR